MSESVPAPDPTELSNLTQHPVTVLLVDDQAMIGEAVRRMLANETDIRFHFCQDPTTALAVSSEVKPTVILQDLIMPQIEGLTLVRYFRANAGTRDIPLIVLSAKEDPKVKAEAFSLGANDYVVKLPDRLELIARIRYHSRGYISMLQRNEAFEALVESQKQLEIRNRFIRETFGRYLSDSIVSSILETPEGLKLGGEKRKVTIMMTDLRGFTALSERLSPENVVAVINNYLEVMTDVIVRYNGTIDEFIGDAILVIFGAPLFSEDDASRAVACAIEMQLAMAEVNSRNEAAGLPEVEMGIGLNTGEVVVGNIGSKKRAKYGVVGSHVNLTSRIESYTTGGQILISPTTRRDVGELLEIRSEWEVHPKGVPDPITIYEVGGINGEYDLHLPLDESSLLFLKRPIDVRYRIVEGKDSRGEELEGRMVRASLKEGEIESNDLPRPLSNLKVTLVAEDGSEITREVYGKVLAKSLSPKSFVIAFTSVPLEAKDFFNARTPGSGE